MRFHRSPAIVPAAKVSVRRSAKLQQKRTRTLHPNDSSLSINVCPRGIFFYLFIYLSHYIGKRCTDFGLYRLSRRLLLFVYEIRSLSPPLPLSFVQWTIDVPATIMLRPFPKDGEIASVPYSSSPAASEIHAGTERTANKRGFSRREPRLAIDRLKTIPGITLQDVRQREMHVPGVL